MTDASDQAPRKRRVPKVMTQKRLRNITAHYLQRHTTTRGHLRILLMRRVRTSLMHHDGDPEEMAAWVDKTVQDVVDQGLVNDRYWAHSRLKRLLKRGMSERAIRAHLRKKFVDPTLIDELLESAKPDPLIAALRYAKRRRLGPFREHSREERRDKDLGKLARSGFSFDVARQVLAMDPDEAFERVYPPFNDPSYS